MGKIIQFPGTNTTPTPSEDELREEYMNNRIRTLGASLKEFFDEEYKKARAESVAMFSDMCIKEEEVMQYIGKMMEINGVYREFTEEDLIAWRQSYLGRNDLLRNIANKIADMSTYANEVAMEYINGEIPSAYAFGRNVTNYEYDNAKGYYNLPLWNERAVKKLLMEKPDLMPNYPEEKAVRRGIDLEYGIKVITRTVSSAVVRGKASREIASELADKLYGSDYVGAMRTARTSLGAALNGGSLDQLYAERNAGVNVEKQWSSTLDERTRESHQHLDQIHLPLEERFSNGCLYPRDPSCPNGAEIYNCRCVVRGFYPEHTKAATRVPYDEWTKSKQDVLIYYKEPEKGAKISEKAKNIAREAMRRGISKLDVKNLESAISDNEIYKTVRRR